jgi:hypothetical protein
MNCFHLATSGTRAHHRERNENTSDNSHRTNKEVIQQNLQNLPPPTKFHGHKSRNSHARQTAQPLKSDQRDFAESSHQVFGRMIAREEAAHWSCTAKELEEISASVADELLMLMKPKP